jgi:uncharacterized protein YbjT (DUF2867 family)
MSGPLFKDVHALPAGSAPIGYTTPLAAFWVGDIDVFAAPSAEAALAVARRPDDEFDALELDDVTEVAAEDLDKPMVEEDGTPCGTLRELLATATEPGWLVGFE